MIRLVYHLSHVLELNASISSLQKLAQRDQQGMVELLQICTLMSNLWDDIREYLGEGKLLNHVMAQWELGYLGCKAGPTKTMYTWRGFEQGQQKPCTFRGGDLSLQSSCGI